MKHFTAQRELVSSIRTIKPTFFKSVMRKAWICCNNEKVVGGVRQRKAKEDDAGYLGVMAYRDIYSRSD